MKYLIFILSMILFSSCCSFCKESCVREVVVYKYNIPPFPCPKKLEPTWEEYSVEKSEAENLLVEPNNIDMARRIIKNRDNIILCYTKNLKLYRMKKEEKVEEEKKNENE